MEEMEEFFTATWDLPENTKEEIINKIAALAILIRMDWSDPRSQCSKISALCEALKLLDKNS